MPERRFKDGRPSDMTCLKVEWPYVAFFPDASWPGFLYCFDSKYPRECFKNIRNRYHTPIGLHTQTKPNPRYFRQYYYFFFQTRDCRTFTLQDFYIESVTAHRIRRNDHSCFHNSWLNSKTKLKLKHLLEQGGPLVFRGPYASLRILRIGRIGSGWDHSHEENNW